MEFHRRDLVYIQLSNDRIQHAHANHLLIIRKLDPNLYPYFMIVIMILYTTSSKVVNYHQQWKSRQKFYLMDFRK